MKTGLRLRLCEAFASPLRKEAKASRRQSLKPEQEEVMKMNNVSLIGRLTFDPELRYTSKGTAVTNLRLARNERAGEKEQTLFVDVTLWGRLAEVVTAHKKKGDQVAVSGRLEYSEYNDDEGRKRSRLKIVANHVEFLACKNGNGHDTDADLSKAHEAKEEPEVEIPF